MRLELPLFLLATGSMAASNDKWVVRACTADLPDCPDFVPKGHLPPSDVYGNLTYMTNKCTKLGLDSQVRGLYDASKTTLQISPHGDCSDVVVLGNNSTALAVKSWKMVLK
ncbi:hypothetical protein N7492_003890 [Penicillium capsulatum]|uniref:Ecp2 effector protein domain-containing protein n=1 Tax=Penicillium capsulatum TaxID=69766 RepID=A0A9W9ILE2_9EURO|nr:hypothetical protein N7492_003890 [Penicillium capsulatum]KAJ6121530.1 hypothetical protein N7512_003995 [Penicillium capsulatum]